MHSPLDIEETRKLLSHGEQWIESWVDHQWCDLHGSGCDQGNSGHVKQLLSCLTKALDEMSESRAHRAQAMQGYRLAKAVIDPAYSQSGVLVKARRLLDMHKGI